ncbi:hypothetical protein ACFY7V_18745 [[Kitasatospora] papulosa]|uniref:Uncharacterized protein n=1 Tax=[Kitasatospora] papulosa TaxID=1464011 RepID=A0ABZ1KH52_9ACTN|nr:hypothetical protein [Streptomyces sp. NRRL S-325]
MRTRLRAVFKDVERIIRAHPPELFASTAGTAPVRRKRNVVVWE